MCSLLSGVFNSRPPQPRYKFISDVQTVIDFIKNNSGNSDEITDKNLTLKVTMLLALLSASRGLGLQHLDIRYMSSDDNCFIFTFHKLHKAWREGKASPRLTFCSYKKDKNLCVVTTLKDKNGKMKTASNSFKAI